MRLKVKAEVRKTFLNLLTDIKAHTSDPKLMELVDTVRTSLDQAESGATIGTVGVTL